MAADDVTIPNPKDIFVAAQPNITALQNQILTGIADTALGIYNNRSSDDVVTAIGMPIFMLQDAVKSMSPAKKIGFEVAEEEKKNLILEILGAVLMVIPFVGEAAGALFGGAAMIGRIAALISEVGNAALSIESIISDPSSAPFVVFGLLAGEAGYAMGKTDEEVFNEAARARRLLSPSELAKFSKEFRENNDLIQKLTSASARKA